MLTDVFSIIFIIIISLLFNLSLRFGTEHYISEKGGLYSSGGGRPSQGETQPQENQSVISYDVQVHTENNAPSALCRSKSIAESFAVIALFQSRAAVKHIFKPLFFCP